MKALDVFIGGECSGVIRRAFRDLGHNAWSCDLKAAEDGSQFHIQGDLMKHKDKGWDITLFHPTCRYLANSGAKHLYLGMKKENGICPDRWSKMVEGAEFFKACLDTDAGHVAAENPVMHGHARGIVGEGHDVQFVQPWMFGHLEVKATGWWKKNLPDLVETDNVKAATMALSYGERAKVHYASPGPEREANRSRTLEGHGRAVAMQWSAYAIEQRRLAA